MQQIQITAATGTPPYDVYICDITLTTCLLISGGTTIPPTIDYTLSGIFENVNPVIIKIVDSDGCEYFEILECTTTTTTSTSTTTTTTLSNCSCLSFQNTGITTYNISFIDCEGSVFNGTIDEDTILYYCGSNPSGDTGVAIGIGSSCVGNTCFPLPVSTKITNMITLCNFVMSEYVFSIYFNYTVYNGSGNYIFQIFSGSQWVDIFTFTGPNNGTATSPTYQIDPIPTLGVYQSRIIDFNFNTSIAINITLTVFCPP